ncbi:hypothetical protein ACFQ60_18050 [Streptomyces zhihengii]
MAGRSTLAKGLTALAVVLAVIGSVTAWILSYQGYLPGDAVVRSWAAPKDRAGDGRPNGTWIAGDVAVRSRYDAVTGFGIGEGQDGRKLWEFVPPGRTRICGSARHADASVLLVAYGQEGGATRGKGCAAVLALDTKDGRELWTAPRTVADGGPEQEEPFLDAGSGLAVIGHHSRSGATAPRCAPSTCAPGSRAGRRRSRTGAVRARSPSAGSRSSPSWGAAPGSPVTTASARPAS